MASAEIKNVRALLANMPRTENPTVAEQRKGYDGAGALMQPPEGTLVLPTEAGMVRGEWTIGPGARSDRAILYLHGGGYVIGSPRSHRHLVAKLSEASGMAALSIDYRLAPEHPFPAAVDDAVEAYRFLLESGFDASRLAVSGDSAGGGLTMALLIALRDAGLPLPAAAAPISPWTNLANDLPSQTSRKAADPMVTKDGLDGMASHYLQGRDAKTPLASPHYANLKGLPPLLIQVGDDEVLLDDGVLLAERARAAGVEATLEVWPDMIHVWHFFWPMLAEGREAIGKIGAFFKAKIR